MNEAIGIDGCKAGWVAVRIGAKGRAEAKVWPQLDELVAAFPKAPLLLIDIPMGLPEMQRRACEAAARKLLTRRRSSSVFPVPSRAAIYAPDYATACANNEARQGVRLSRQLWNIRDKIIEADQLLQQRPALRGRLRESHPELAFHGLAGGRPMEHAKRTPEGQAERLQVLQGYLPEAASLLQESLATYPRKALAADDLLDALALAITARQPGQLISIPAEPESDALGIPMEIVFSRARAAK